ncbi:MAG: monovalent cation/H+ antiporter complex subunit F [Candidatus Hadarchaeia archaeon]
MMLIGSVGILIAASLICLIRAGYGPSFADRVISIDTFTSFTIAILILLSIIYEESMLLDIALVYAFLAFIGTLAVSKYLEGRNLKE